MTTSGNLMTTPNDTNGDDPKAPKGDGIHHDRDLQRHALRELVELANQCATDETDVEQRHTRDVAKEADDFEKKNYAAEHRAKQMEEAIRTKYQERADKGRAQFAADTASIREAHDKDKRKVQAQYGPVEQDVKKKYDEAVWLADAELEARQNQIRVEERQANDDLKAHGEEVDDLEGRAIGVLKKYRHKPSDQDASLMATADGEKREPGNFAAKRDAALNDLHTLESLFVPRLFVGARPFLILFVLLAVAGGVTYAMNMNDPQKAYDPMAYAVTCGGTLVAAIAIGVAARVIAKGSIRKAWTRTKKHLNEAREAAKVDHEQALKLLADRGEAATQKRNNEVTQLKAKYNPMLSQATAKKKAALAALEEKNGAKMKSFEEKRKALLVEQDAWRDRHLLDDVQNKLKSELANNKAKHEARVKEIEDTYQAEKSALAARWRDGLARIAAPMQDGANGNGRTIYDWEGTDWHKWKAP